MLRLLIPLFLLLAAGTAAARDEPLRLLFVGNSLTYTNELPAMVQRLAAMDGRRCVVKAVTAPNSSLGDHLQAGRLRRELRERWDYVVLQQGPSSLPESRRQLLADVRRIADETRPNRIAMLMVWPAAQHAASWNRATESYRLAAEAVDGVLIPAGAALRTLLQDHPKMKLLGADGFHPAPAGTYLAALATYRALFGRVPGSASDLAGARKVARLPLDVDRKQLQLIVDVVNRAHGSASLLRNPVMSPESQQAR